MTLPESPSGGRAGLLPVGRLALALGLGLAAACGEPPPPLIDAMPPIRLVDHLAAARVDSPLLSAPPLESRLRELAADDSAASWRAELSPEAVPGRRNCRISAGVIECEGGEGGFELRLMVPVGGADYTLVVPEVRAPEPGCVMLTVKDAAERRRLPLPADASDWRRLPVLWPGRPEIGEVLVRLTRRRLAGPCLVELRGVSVFPLAADSELRLALLEARRGGYGGAAAPFGFGDFLPLADAETVEPPFDENFSAREVLVAPAPTEIRFRLRLPRQARLGFSYALSREAVPGERVDFEVRARAGGGGERILWSQRLVLAPQSWHWYEASVPLTELGGQEIELVLATRSPDGGAAPALWGTPTVERPRRAGGPPNVVLIAVDTLRADRLSSYGYPGATTPRLDRFAEDGVLFWRAVSQSNWTLPSFASIFTGKIVPRHRLATFASRLPAGAETLARLLRTHGWRTDAVLCKPALYRRLEQGFETAFNLPRRHHLADDSVKQALEVLRRRQDQRFFLFLHFDDPHQPFTQPPEFRQAATTAGLAALGLELPLDLPTELRHCSACKVDGRDSPAVRELGSELYDEEVRYVDDRIGRFLDELERLGLYEEAVIAFVSDHGETLWSHYDYFRHGGANLHDELIRVPLIIKPAASSGFRRGAVVRDLVRAFDLMPTLLELAGVEAPAGLDAVSLAGLLRQEGGGEAARSRPAFSQSAAAAAYLSGRFKYIMPVGSGFSPGRPSVPRLAGEELYDLEADPGELRDLAAADPATLGRLRREAIEYLLGALGGDFLLVVGGEVAEEPLEVSCEPACSWDPLLQFGRGRQAGSVAGVDRFTGPGLGRRVLLLARVSAGGGAIEVRAGGRSAPASALDFEPGLMARLLDGGEELAAWLVSAPDRGFGELEEATLDSQQEDALRALGYLQ